MKTPSSSSILVTADNPALAELKLSWRTAEFSAEDGIGPMRSLCEAGDALVAVARMDDEGLTVLGSGVMVGPGLLITATHVLDEFGRDSCPIFLTFLPERARAWLPIDCATWTGPSQFYVDRVVSSDVSLVSCTLNSDAHGEFPLTLAPMKIALPLVGERLWAFGFRHQAIEDGAACITPLVSSGLVTAAFPQGRGERMPSPCSEVDMETVGGMSGGAVVNAAGDLVGIVSSSIDGGPSYVTLIWDAIRFRVKGAIPKLQRDRTVSLLGAQALHQAKIDGKVSRNPWGDVTLTLSSEEGTLIESSAPSNSNPTLSDDEVELLLETWGGELETMGSVAAIGALSRFSLDRVRAFLGAEEIPEHCLAAIEGFEVEDFDGPEDLEVISTELLDHSQIEVEYFFELRILTWTVVVSPEAYARYATDFDEHFHNKRDEHDAVRIEIYQRCHFRAVATLDRETLSPPRITSSAIARRRYYSRERAG